MSEYKDKINQSNDGNNAKGLLQYDSKEKQTIFKFFGVEMTAPKNLKNPRLVYISFILINVFLLILLKNFISN